jgi:hypothetical protein
MFKPSYDGLTFGLATTEVLTVAAVTVIVPVAPIEVGVGPAAKALTHVRNNNKSNVKAKTPSLPNNLFTVNYLLNIFM